jgi:hypothetical protein
LRFLQNFSNLFRIYAAKTKVSNFFFVATVRKFATPKEKKTLELGNFNLQALVLGARRFAGSSAGKWR